MAVAAEILLLVALISNNIHADIIQSAGTSHNFILDKTADFCLISRWTGEEKMVLWNSSGPHDSVIFNLNVSDSGRYQEQCWTQGIVTHKRNSTLLVCDDHKMRFQRLYPDVGQTVELTCDGAGPNQSFQWFVNSENYKTENVEFVLIDDETSSVYKLQIVKNKSSLLVAVNRPSDDVSYYCLEKNHQWCDLLTEFLVHVPPEIILGSVGDSLDLNCSEISGKQPHVWRTVYKLMDDDVSHNYTLMFPSLTLTDTGYYTCEYSDLSRVYYYLYVCPESYPPAVAYFTGVENVTLQCGDWKQTKGIDWFMRSNRTKGRITRLHNYRQDEMYFFNTSLVITNVSLDHGGEFWCVIMEEYRCVFTSKTLMMFREPEVDHHLVRSVLLSVLIMMMCAVVVAAVWRTRSREQLPVPVEEVEMYNLSTAPQ